MPEGVKPLISVAPLDKHFPLELRRPDFITGEGRLRHFLNIDIAESVFQNIIHSLVSLIRYLYYLLR